MTNPPIFTIVCGYNPLQSQTKKAKLWVECGQKTTAKQLMTDYLFKLNNSAGDADFALKKSKMFKQTIHHCSTAWKTNKFVLWKKSRLDVKNEESCRTEILAVLLVTQHQEAKKKLTHFNDD